MRNLDTDRYFFTTNGSDAKEYTNNLAQFYKHIAIIPLSFSFFGYCGLRGPKGDKKELQKNLVFLMKYHKEPFIINKVNLFENEKSIMTTSLDEIKSYSWLFVFDKININCFNCFNSFSKLVDFKKDKVSALTLLSSHMTEDDIKPKFTKELNDRGITNFSYISDTYVSESSAIVKRKVNFESEQYDFVVIYNSYNNTEVNRANYEKQNVANYDIITNCLSNICVHNGS